MIERLEQYIIGMNDQLENAKKQVAGLEGALQFAKQLIEDLEKEEAEVAEEEPE